MKFKAPDGQEFSDKKEYREYMMEVYYSFKNKSSDDGTLIKSPGDIEGQVFDIADCSNCTMVVMDITDQVQIDNLTNCKVFIGACSSSLYIRNCTDCVFYTCSRQLRLRDITNSSFYSYCQSEIHIELSSAVRFGPFLGGYEEQEQHFKSASLDPEVNLWNDIYDHNDAAKTHKNWSVI
ncbi:tubulin binding cofactor C-domain-containing protein, partial [Ochromonadaceae sp. CCMP2298]